MYFHFELSPRVWPLLKGTVPTLRYGCSGKLTGRLRTSVRSLHSGDWTLLGFPALHELGIAIQSSALQQVTCARAHRQVSFHTCTASQPSANNPKRIPTQNSYPCSYHKGSFSLFLCPATPSYFGSLEFHYLPSELNFELEPHHSVPKPERGPRQKARAIVGLTVFLDSRLRALCYLSMPENSKNLISYVSFRIRIFRCFIYFVQFIVFFLPPPFFGQESKSTIIPVSWSEAEVNDY